VAAAPRKLSSRNIVAIAVSVVGATDSSLADRLRASGLRPTAMSVNDLAALAQPMNSPPDIVVLDLRATRQIPPVLNVIKRQHPDTGLIVVAATLDPVLMLEAMRSGVTECVTDLDRGDLEAAIDRLIAQRTSPVRGEVFVFVGAKGGVGTTTAAVNVATALSKLGTTLVVDLHLSGGDAGLFLGADSHFSVLDALENTHRLDVAYFRGLVAHTKAGPDLLASSDRATAAVVDTSRVRTLIDFSAHHYRYTVVDIPRSEGAVLDSLDDAARIVVVANQELATIRSSGRLVEMLRQRYGREKVAVVLSRADREAEIGLEDLQSAVRGEVAHVFPSDYRLAVHALNRGQPIVNDGKSPLGSAFQAFARDLAGAKQDAPPADKPGGSGLFGRLTGRR
jgi:pilus assembly protein CpaE